MRIFASNWVNEMHAILAALVLTQQQPCGPTGIVEKQMADKFGESIVGAGFMGSDVLLTLTNPETGTFTILVRRQDGMTCLLMSGTGYAFQEPTKGGKNL